MRCEGPGGHDPTRDAKMWGVCWGSVVLWSLETAGLSQGKGSVRGQTKRNKKTCAGLSNVESVTPWTVHDK